MKVYSIGGVVACCVEGSSSILASNADRLPYGAKFGLPSARRAEVMSQRQANPAGQQV